MKCPMLTMYAITFNPPEEFRDRDCLKEECAWFRPGDQECSIAILAATLDEIAKTGFPVRVSR